MEVEALEAPAGVFEQLAQLAADAVAVAARVDGAAGPADAEAELERARPWLGGGEDGANGLEGLAQLLAWGRGDGDERQRAEADVVADRLVAVGRRGERD
jgi:hypothetical protein